MKSKSFPLPYLLLVLYLIEFILLGINPYDRAVWFAENLPVLIVVGILVATYKKFQFSNASYVLMWIFFAYHTIGGHYTFEKVPFDFFNALLEKTNMSFLFPDGRNNFDRVGHFLVGVFAYPFAEWVFRKRWAKGVLFAAFVGVFAIGFWAALYEVIEMIYAITQGGAQGTAFLGSQGDIWDAQKDMLLDILGACFLSLEFYLVWRKKSIS